MRLCDATGHWACAIALTALVGACASPVTAQSVDQSPTLLEQAAERFRAADYLGAIEYLERALASTPNDAEIHFNLGYYKHYLCYDSVPLTGSDEPASDEVLHHLNKAVELKPDYGDGYYFIGTEYGARARAEMQLARRDAASEQYRLGHRFGGYPPWFLEAGRNMLRSCDRSAILFVGGDADANAALYLQYVEGFRTDITVIPVGLLDRPWFITFLKYGGSGTVTPAPVSWSDQQISSMRPYKWRTNTVACPISEATKAEYGLAQDSVEWELAPDLGRDGSLHLLSAARAAFADIIRSNRWERPVYLSLYYPGGIESGLHDNLQLQGFVQRLLPYVPKSKVDAAATRELLLDPNGFQHLGSYSSKPMPRAATLLQGYRPAFMRLIYYYLENLQPELAAQVLAAMDEFVDPSIVAVTDQHRRAIDAFRESLLAVKEGSP